MKPREEIQLASTGAPPRRRPSRQSPDHLFHPQRGQERPLRARQQGESSSSPSSSSPPAPSPPDAPFSASAGASVTAASAGSSASASPSGSSWASAPSSSFTGPADSGISGQNASSTLPPGSFPSQNASAPFNSSMPWDSWNTTTNSSYPLYPTSTSISRTWSSFTKSKPWSTSSKTSTGKDSRPTFVPGQLFNMTMGGRDHDTVYSVPMFFGHEPQGNSYNRKRQDWNGTAPQVLNMMVDLGSSDMVGCDLSR